MDPVPPDLRTWSSWAYVAYWISDATNTGVWELASSMLAVGLSWYPPIPFWCTQDVLVFYAGKKHWQLLSWAM